MSASDGPAWAHAMYDYLRAQGVTQIAYVPDAGHRVMIDRSLADADAHSLPVITAACTMVWGSGEAVAVLLGQRLLGAKKF